METGRRAFVAVDVHYLGSGGARAAAVVAAEARFSEVVAERTEVVAEVLPYRPGEFYLRELPLMRAVLDGLSGVSLLVVDGYADLDPDGRPGQGGHAHAEFGVPVIGVAKSAFRTATHAVPVLRGTSVPKTSSTSCDQAIFVGQAAGESVFEAVFAAAGIKIVKAPPRTPARIVLPRGSCERPGQSAPAGC